MATSEKAITNFKSFLPLAFVKEIAHIRLGALPLVRKQVTEPNHFRCVRTTI